jgi:hypothetical protein
MAPAATTGPTTLAASSSRRSVLGSLSDATRPDERLPFAVFDVVFEDVFGAVVDGVEDFMRALRRIATLLPPRAGGRRVMGNSRVTAPDGAFGR